MTSTSSFGAWGWGWGDDLAHGGWVVPADIPAAEAAALKWLYYATGGDSWTTNTNWGLTATAANWHGITMAGGKVTKIELGANNLAGDVTSFAVDAFTTLQWLYLNNNVLTGSPAAWVVSNTAQRVNLSGIAGFTADMSGFAIPTGIVFLFLHVCNFTGDMTAITWPASTQRVYLYDNGFTGDLSSMVINAGMTQLYLDGNSFTGSPDISANTAMSIYKLDDNGLIQAHVDAALLAVYTIRANFTDATPEFFVGGTNAAPSGIYQDGDPPTTGKEYAFELENDPEAEGFNAWAIDFTA